MALTREFKESIRERAEIDAEFRMLLLGEGVECLKSGEFEVGKSLLRDYINATLGLTKTTDRSATLDPDP
ncbi:MAG: hypothetical protein F4Y22_01695 [Gammaproteobacteria bacterium]|nr:hypothetical protein [Gammaproteobacteria bacterium]MYA65985.1 hypothetical protein [Gammaproteobacteria bacterium]MYG96831.1 hypothetical protein [Gammaproteobacteria bacterium]MYH45375.1 hypothetical protein [Gammaproteobacteria bacterium]MYL14180.1 hypothetical protein [Gammaproteobacteria bacterium]